MWCIRTCPHRLMRPALLSESHFNLITIRLSLTKYGRGGVGGRLRSHPTGVSPIAQGTLGGGGKAGRQAHPLPGGGGGFLFTNHAKCQK